MDFCDVFFDFPSFFRVFVFPAGGIKTEFPQRFAFFLQKRLKFNFCFFS